MLGFIASSGERDLLLVETSRGAEQTVSTAKYEVTGRGGRGRELLQRGQFARVITPLPGPILPTSALARIGTAFCATVAPASAQMRSICKLDGRLPNLSPL